jgi:hypothetical protein
MNVLTTTFALVHPCVKNAVAGVQEDVAVLKILLVLNYGLRTVFVKLLHNFCCILATVKQL